MIAHVSEGHTIFNSKQFLNHIIYQLAKYCELIAESYSTTDQIFIQHTSLVFKMRSGVVALGQRVYIIPENVGLE